MDEKMRTLYALLQLYGERYILNDKGQARMDLEHNRDAMINAYLAILDYCKQ